MGYGIPKWWLAVAATVALLAMIVLAVRRVNNPVLRIRDAKAPLTVRIKCKCAPGPHTTANQRLIRRWMADYMYRRLSDAQLDFRDYVVQDQIRAVLRDCTKAMEENLGVDVIMMSAKLKWKWKLPVLYLDR